MSYAEHIRINRELRDHIKFPKGDVGEIAAQEDDFSSYAVGTTDTGMGGWRADHASFSDIFGILESSSYMGADSVGGHVIYTLGQNWYPSWLIWELAGVVTDVEITAVMGGNRETELTAPALVGRYSWNGGSPNAYAIMPSGTSTKFSLFKQTNGIYTEVDSVAVAFNEATWYKYKLNIQGDTIKGKIWVDGTAEPSEWMVSYTDPSPIANGEVGYGKTTVTNLYASYIYLVEL